MITLYNETKISWGLETVNNMAIRLSKSRERRSDKGITTKRTVSIITYAHLFEDLKKVRGLLTETRMKDKPVEPVLLTDKSTSITFNKKEFKPFISERSYNTKHILLGSLFLQGKKIIHVKNDHSFLLEFYMLNAEFSFIASFNSDSASMQIDLLDQKTNTVTCYTFAMKDGKIVVETKERAATKRDITGRYHIRVFRPAKPTYAILVSPEDLDALERVVDTSKHNVIVCTNFAREADLLVQENYKAITIFADSTFRGETQQQCNVFKRVFHNISPKFQTVFKLHKDGKVEKLKY